MTLGLLVGACSAAGQGLAQPLKTAGFDFRFASGDELAALELNFSDPAGTPVMTLTLVRDGRLWKGRVSDAAAAAGASTWQFGTFQVTDAAEDALDILPADMPAGFFDLPLLGRISTDGSGDGWQQGGGTALVLKRSDLQDLAGMELVLMEGTCKIINLSWRSLGGKLRSALSLLEPGYVDLAPLVAGMTATDEALVIEINGGDGIYGTDAGVVEARGISRDLLAAGWQETGSHPERETTGDSQDDTQPETADGMSGETVNPDGSSTSGLPAAGLPASSSSPADGTWHTASLKAEGGFVVLSIDGVEAGRFDLETRAWGKFGILVQNLPGAEYRSLKVQ